MTPATPQLPAPFPRERADAMQAPALLAERGFSVRAAHDGDLPWLRKLYASTRTQEMSSVPWPETAKRHFLDQQFALQHAHYLAHYGDADFLVIEHAAHGPIGRLYLQRSAPDHLLVDISLFPALRGTGVGTALIRHAQQDAAARSCALRLHVLQSNGAARRLYERLGFVAGDAAGAHLSMRWSGT